MTPGEINDAIFEYMNTNWSYTPIAYHNTVIDLDQEQPWIRLSPKFSFSIEGEKGEDGVGLRNGILYISIFVTENTGWKLGDRYANKVEDLFRKKIISCIVFGEPFTDHKGRHQTEYYHILVTIPFHTFIGE